MASIHEDGIPDYKYGMKIRQREHHIPVHILESLRFVSDDLADEALQALQNQSISVDDYLEEVRTSYINNNDLKYNDNSLKVFARSITTYPYWLDLQLLREGTVVLYKYSLSSAMGLLYYSLVGGFSAPKIVKVLDQTAYLTKGNYDQTFKRLNETLEMVLDSIETPDNLKIGNEGWLSVLKVRFIHARVRNRIKSQTEKYDTSKYGIPINEEDMIVTLCSFSINVLETIKKVGAPITRREEEAYIHLWRYIGYLIGINEDLNPCSSIEKCLGSVESIVCHILVPDGRSGEVARHVLRSIAYRPLLNWSYLCHSSLLLLFSLGRVRVSTEQGLGLFFPMSSIHYVVLLVIVVTTSNSSTSNSSRSSSSSNISSSSSNISNSSSSSSNNNNNNNNNNSNSSSSKKKSNDQMKFNE